MVKVPEGMPSLSDYVRIFHIHGAKNMAVQAICYYNKLLIITDTSFIAVTLHLVTYSFCVMHKL
jgi:hypothetical protein